MSKEFNNQSNKQVSDTTSDLPQSLSRRRLLQILSTSGGAMVGNTLLPGKWIKPVIEVGALPVHAQTSPVASLSITATWLPISTQRSLVVVFPNNTVSLAIRTIPPLTFSISTSQVQTGTYRVAFGVEPPETSSTVTIQITTHTASRTFVRAVPTAPDPVTDATRIADIIFPTGEIIEQSGTIGPLISTQTHSW